MAQPYVGEIRMFAGNFAPAGWMFCEGQTLSITAYNALYYLIGTTYGGDGVNTFNLPDLRGRVPVHMGQGPGLSAYALAETGGVEQVNLNVDQMPSHTHPAAADGGTGTAADPAGAFWAASTAVRQYSDQGTTGAMDASTVGSAGGGQSHENRPPFLAVSFIISLSGVFPTHS